MHQDFGSVQLKKNNRKRAQQSDNFDNNIVPPQNDCEEFRPMLVIDHQYKTHSKQSFEDQSFSTGNCSPNRHQPTDYFPRKIIEYDHKSNVHPWNWFCPVVQIEYNHTNTGFSLHEHPPTEIVGKIQAKQHWSKQVVPKDDYNRLRQSTHGPIDHQERLPHGGSAQGQQQQHYQSRYENQQNLPSNSQPMGEMYYRRNLQDQNWLQKVHERKTPYEK